MRRTKKLSNTTSSTRDVFKQLETLSISNGNKRVPRKLPISRPSTTNTTQILLNSLREERQRISADPKLSREEKIFWLMNLHEFIPGSEEDALTLSKDLNSDVRSLMPNGQTPNPILICHFFTCGGGLCFQEKNPIVETGIGRTLLNP